MDLRILEIASHTDNNKIIEDFTHKSKHKNPLCGDEMEIRLIIKDDVIKDMGYQCKSCVYCQASVSLLSRSIKNQSIENVKVFALAAKSSFEKKIEFEKEWKNFNKIIPGNNISRKECLLLPINAAIDALS